MSPVKKTDGRHARKARTREAIVEALLSLLDDGLVEPTAAQIATRADVAVRSISQHFRTREELLLAVASRNWVRLPALTPPTPGRPFEARLIHFVVARVKILEENRALRRAAVRGAGDSKAIAKGIVQIARRRREELLVAFEELAKAPAWQCSAAEALSSGAVWDALRAEQELSVADAEKAVLNGLRKLLA